MVSRNSFFVLKMEERLPLSKLPGTHRAASAVLLLANQISAASHDPPACLRRRFAHLGHFEMLPVLGRPQLEAWLGLFADRSQQHVYGGQPSQHYNMPHFRARHLVRAAQGTDRGACGRGLYLILGWRRSTIEVSPRFSEAPHLRSSTPHHPKTDFSKKLIASRRIIS